CYALDFLCNNKRYSRSYFEPARGAFKRNQFCGTVGGPVVKNKIFVFGDYQGTREIRGVSSGLINVPSQLERGGDFSDLGTTGFGTFSQVIDDPNNPGQNLTF